ncbi:phage shock protein PspA [Desulfobacter latus]|uniref:Phage shock protein PspA n=1 Tax=Desulfobacter latus TaxID=2292 RepID=A0A850T9J7_9BACT|nr:phage shock protein PspA [Desulfobacter latus]NWH04877.1 phage shock protein PspA [Desulfobacter latus]
MGIFTRFRDIVSSNINAMLDKAEDPEKMIKLMIREMEDTLIELKSSCAATIANHKKVERLGQEVREKEAFWNEKAELAVTKGRDDLARQALMERRRFSRRLEVVETELVDLAGMVDQYKNDITELENKLKSAREKQRMLVQRHIRAQHKKRAKQEIRRAEATEVIKKFEEMENHIERMEAEADLVDFGRRSSLETAFDDLAADEEIENELNALKSSQSGAINDTKTQN